MSIETVQLKYQTNNIQISQETTDGTMEVFTEKRKPLLIQTDPLS